LENDLNKQITTMDDQAFGSTFAFFLQRTIQRKKKSKELPS